MEQSKYYPMYGYLLSLAVFGIALDVLIFDEDNNFYLSKAAAVILGYVLTTSSNIVEVGRNEIRFIQNFRFWKINKYFSLERIDKVEIHNGIGTIIKVYFEDGKKTFFSTMSAKTVDSLIERLNSLGIAALRI